MRAYLINPAERTITAIDYEYATLTKYLPGGLAIGSTFPNGDVLFVDDEGLMRPAVAGFRIRRRTDGQPMMSNGILTGRDNPDPRIHNARPPLMSIRQLEAEIEWLDLDDAMDWFRQRRDEPAVTITTATERTTLAPWGDFVEALEGKAP